LRGGSGLCFLRQSQLAKTGHVLTNGNSVVSGLFHRTFAFLPEQTKPILLSGLLIYRVGHIMSFARQLVDRSRSTAWLGAIVFHRLPHAAAQCRSKSHST
jgi:hypothetical protein